MEPSTKTIYEYLNEKTKNQPLFRDDSGESLTCGQAKAKVDAMAAGLQDLGVRAGDVLALRFPRTASAALVEFALLTLGAAALLTDPHATKETYLAGGDFVGLDGYLTDENGAWLLIQSDGSVRPLTESDRPFAAPKQDAMAPAVLISTSGSTGKTKTVVLSQYNIVNNLVDAAAFGDYVPGDLALGILPLFHIFGQVLLFGSLILDYAILFPEIVSADSALRCVETFGVTRMNGVPSLYKAMAEKAGDYDVSTLRVGFIGGSPCTVREIRDIEAKLGMKLLNAYGMSECVSISISSAADPLEKRIGGVGHIYPLSRVEIVGPDGRKVEPGEQGEITVQGASRMLGYFRDPEATRAAIDADGFLHTGDLGYLDGDGILHITGRIKEIIIRNGVNLSARRIEEALLSVPGVSAAAVVGIPDAKQGEVPAAMAVSDRTEVELLADLAEKLPKNEIPVRIWLTESIPLTPSGKPDKQTIQKLLQKA